MGDTKLPQVKRDTWCRHRTPFGSDYPVCKVGVNYHPFMDDYKNMPCLGETQEAKDRCPQYSGWTDEELRKREEEITASLKRMGVIRKAIVKAVAETGVRGGAMPCPACETGTVHYSQAASNGHVHARCSTPNCAAWME